jgi:hypothetical protein
MRRTITPEQWAAIRTSWEYDPDEPSDDTAARRAAERLKFKAPNNSAVIRRRKKDAAASNPWERRGTMNGIVHAAQRRADTMVTADGEAKAAKAEPESSEVVAIKAQAAREESEALRAEVIARHRQEWRAVVVLRNEAIKERTAAPDKADKKARLAKIIAETTKIQQEGERKAWGLDVSVNPDDIRKMSDAELEAIVKGKL